MSQQAVEWQPVWAQAALEAAAFSQPLLATELQLSDEKWVKFNWGCISVWSEVGNFGRSIPKRLTHPFQPRGLYNMLYEGFCLFCFLHMKQILTHSSALRGGKLQDSRIKTVSHLPGTSLPQEVLTVPCVSVFSPQGTLTLKRWWTIMGNSGFLLLSFFLSFFNSKPYLYKLGTKGTQ